MAGFPSTPLPARVRIWPGVDPSSAPETWPAPREITSSVRVEQGIVISYGKGDEAADVDPSEMSLSIDNRSGNFTPTNPLGQDYPNLRRNTPIRVTTDLATDAFTRTVAAGAWGTTTTSLTGGYVWDPRDPADFSVNGTQGLIAVPATNTTRPVLLTDGNATDVRGAVTVTTPVLPTGAAFSVGAYAHYYDAANYHMLQMQFLTGGTVLLRLSKFTPAGFANILDVNLGAYSAAQPWRLYWEVLGPTVLMKAGPVSGGEPALWQFRYDDDDTQIGSRNGLFAWRILGNTNVGSITFTYDDYFLEAIEFQGYLTELPTRWDITGRDSIVPMKAAGILRRLQQGATPLKSPLYRQLSGDADPNVKPSSYWPCEDDNGATTGANAVTGGNPLSVTDVTFGAATDLVSALQVARLNSAASKMTGVVRKPNGTTGFSAMWLFRFPAAIVGTNDFVTVGTNTTAAVTRWTVTVGGASVTLKGFDVLGATIVNTTVLWAVDPTKWVAMQLETEVVGANTNYALIWHQIGETTYYVINGSYASTVVSKVGKITISSNANLAGTFISHVWVGDNALPFVSNAFSLVSNAYIGELSGDRFERLLREEGVAGIAEKGYVEPMGAQAVDALVPLLRSCANAEYGVMYEYGYGLGLRPRSRRYSRTATAVLSFTSGHIADAPEPTYDDQSIRNDWIVSRAGGSQGVRFKDDVSIAAEGRYDTSTEINVATDDALLQHAAWRTYLGAATVMRWPRVTFDLASRIAVIPAWRQTQPYGQRVTITNPPTQVAGATVDLIVEGWSQILSAFQWDVTLNCSPAEPWNSPTYDDTDARYDSDSTTLNAGVTSSATSMVFSTSNSLETWSTTETPYDVVISGEVVTVTAMGAVSGAGPYLQTATVTRNVGALPTGKAQLAGAKIQLARPARYAL